MSDSYIWPIDRTISCSTNPGGQSGSRSNVNEGVPRIPQSVRSGASTSDCFVSYPEYSLVGGVLPLCRDAIDVFFSPSRLDCYEIVITSYWNTRWLKYINESRRRLTDWKKLFVLNPSIIRGNDSVNAA